MMCEGMRGLGGLHDCTEELLYLPSSKQLFSNPQYKRWVELELDGSIRLLDLLGSLRDCMMTTIEQIRDLEIALRRQGEAAAQSKNKMHARIHSDTKLEKDIKKCFRLLKEMDDNYVLFYGGSRNGHRNAIFARPLFGSRRAGCIGRKHLRARLRPPDSVVYNRPDVAMADQETATAMLSLPAPIRKQKDSLHRAETSTCSCSSS
ncbi:hypothetical protein BHM03_00050281 [Ensete ventricosum]|nr:hypothetical protein BHM03_00050281 [Ensete ventricosum]